MIPLAEEVSQECLWWKVYGGKNLPKR